MPVPLCGLLPWVKRKQKPRPKPGLNRTIISGHGNVRSRCGRRLGADADSLINAQQSGEFLRSTLML
jgi:hypothetical protein